MTWGPHVPFHTPMSSCKPRVSQSMPQRQGTLNLFIEKTRLSFGTYKGILNRLVGPTKFLALAPTKELCIYREADSRAGIVVNKTSLHVRSLKIITATVKTSQNNPKDANSLKRKHNHSNTPERWGRANQSLLG